MRFVGKREDRMRLPEQLRFPTDLAAKVRAMGAMYRRTYELQILYLVEQGIRFEESGKKDEVANSHTASHGGTR
jgi:hypothetical protein